MIQSLLRSMELLELLKETNHKYSIAEHVGSHRPSAQHDSQNPPDVLRKEICDPR